MVPEVITLKELNQNLDFPDTPANFSGNNRNNGLRSQVKNTILCIIYLVIVGSVVFNSVSTNNFMNRLCSMVNLMNKNNTGL